MWSAKDQAVQDKMANQFFQSSIVLIRVAEVRDPYEQHDLRAYR